MTPMQKKFTFSGHDSFQCRNLWLKKGYDFIKSGKSFNDDDAVVSLGVGKNMTAAIRFWMKAFNLFTQDDKLTLFAHKLLADEGYDPYLEDEASLWLLHYQLVSNGFASTYSIVFNELRKEKIEFSKENFIACIKRKAETNKALAISENTLSEDFSVLSKMYISTEEQNKDKEDNFSGLLTDLDLVKSFSKGKNDFLIIENNERPEIPDEVILYAILDNPDFDLSINFNNLEQDYNSVCSVFAMNRSGILSKIESISSRFGYVVFNDQAGIKELQFKKRPSAFSILDKYYAN
jgi:Protein of unknown function (DUF4007)